MKWNHFEIADCFGLCLTPVLRSRKKLKARKEYFIVDFVWFGTAFKNTFYLRYFWLRGKKYLAVFFDYF